MVSRRRECALALAFLLAVACGSGTRSAAPSPAPATAATTAPTTVAPSSTSTDRVSPAASTPAAPRAYVFGVIGDYGVDADPVRQVVAAMLRFNAGRPLDGVFTTGDNAYCCGSTTQSAFARRMLEPLRLQGAPVHSALGNHDVKTADGADFMRTFPQAKRWYTVVTGPVQFVVLDSNRVSDAGQLAFLKGVLAKPRPVAFRVVLFHHPAWSCSAHEADSGVKSTWLPLFGTKVDLVLAGHNHTYERFAAANGTPYVTTGGGGADLYPSAAAACRGAGTMKVIKTVHHALRLVATPTTLRVDAIGTDGVRFDTVTVRKR